MKKQGKLLKNNYLVKTFENFRESGTLLDRCVPHLEQGAKHKIKKVVNYHYGESWRRSGNTHPRASKKTL